MRTKKSVFCGKRGDLCVEYAVDIKKLLIFWQKCAIIRNGALK